MGGENQRSFSKRSRAGFAMRYAQSVEIYVRGKFTSRDGFNMIENAEVMK